MQVSNTPDVAANDEDEKVRIDLDVEGATEEDLARGVAAAHAVFEAAGVAPWDAAYAHFNMDRWYEDAPPTTDADIALANVYSDAIEAALVATCRDLPDTAKKFDFCLRAMDEPPYRPGPEVLEVIRPFTHHGRPADQLPQPQAGKRRQLVGMVWEWVYLN